jgi:hypothetical protein
MTRGGLGAATAWTMLEILVNNEFILKDDALISS